MYSDDQNFPERGNKPINSRIRNWNKHTQGQAPGSYHGTLRKFGDGVIKALEDQLKEVDTAQDQDDGVEDTKPPSIMEDSTNENSDLYQEDSASKAPDADQPVALRKGSRKSSKSQQQTQNETTTGDTPPDPGKPTRK
jgi:hypothetical protein